jgi:hypothetical protein
VITETSFGFETPVISMAGFVGYFFEFGWKIFVRWRHPPIEKFKPISSHLNPTPKKIY